MEDDVLFENYFHFTKDGNKDKLESIINVILNSYEFSNFNSELLSLSVSPIRDDKYYLSGLYSVNKKYSHQNRDFTGSIEYIFNKAVLCLCITKYGNKTDKVYLDESYIFNNYKIYRISSYSNGVCSKDIIDYNDFFKIDKFKDSTIKKLKRV